MEEIDHFNDSLGYGVRIQVIKEHFPWYLLWRKTSMVSDKESLLSIVLHFVWSFQIKFMILNIMMILSLYFFFL